MPREVRVWDKHKNILACLISLPALFSCGQPSNPYFPLEMGLTREYSIRKTAGENTVLQKLIVSGLPSRNVNGRTVYPQQSASGTVYYYVQSPEGIKLINIDSNQEITILGTPLEKGTQWQQHTRVHLLDIRNETFSTNEPSVKLDSDIPLAVTIENVGETTTVPAGTFPGCIKITAEGSAQINQRALGIRTIHVIQTEWYAPGAGLIKRIRNETTEPAEYRGEYIQELENWYTN